MPIGIRPINDFAFKKTFGSPENRPALISLLNAILELPSPIAEVTLQNPYNSQDFKDDKLSILDIRAVDENGVIYDIEMQLSNFAGLEQRIVFYGCEIYAGQMKSGDEYAELKPVFSICLLDGVLWKDSPKVHHAFRLTDQESGRVLGNTLEIHTLELGCYNLAESELANASRLDRWIFWLLHAHLYDREKLLSLFPESEIALATNVLKHIAEITEDKIMYDSREKARRDRQWALNASRREGLLEGKREGMREGIREGMREGEIVLIRTLEELLGRPLSSEQDVEHKSLEELQTISARLKTELRGRTS